METTLTKEMLELIAQLGALVKADPRCTAIEHTIEDYERSEDLNALIGEYNAQQNLLADAYAKGDELTDEVRTAIQNRIDALYEQIVNHPVYVAYVEAKNAFDALTTEIFGELQFVITGQRPCSHNCSSCHADCSHNNG
jgi:cell fate (sporulation/competence/biofilm development) regulator YlbF (YheA/YmcA/DUF963 family)